MHIKDDKRKLAVPRKEDHQCDIENVSPRLGVTSGESSVLGDESNKIFNSDSSWRNSSPEQDFGSRQRNSGKMLCQLRELNQSHLAFVDKYQQLLETQLAQNLEYRGRILDDMNRLEEQILQLLGEEESG